MEVYHIGWTEGWEADKNREEPEVAVIARARLCCVLSTGMDGAHESGAGRCQRARSLLSRAELSMRSGVDVSKETAPAR